MARVLVTGALGNVGREVARACAEAGFTVRAADLDEASVRERLSGCEAARLDFTDRATWAAALAGADFVFLLRPPPLSDMRSTLNPFVDAAWAAGVRHVVFLSVAGADRMKWVPHRKVELHLEGSGDDRWTVLRPGFFAQNLQDAYRRDIVEDGRIFVPAAKGRVAFLDVRDAADVTVRIFQDPGAYRRRALTLTGPRAVTFAEVAEAMSRVLGRPVRYEPASVLGYARHLRRRGAVWPQVLVQVVLHVGLRRGDAEAVDPTVEQVLGRRAGALEAYVERAAQTWR